MHGECVIERRRNYLGRWIVVLHQQYCVPGLIPVLWALVAVGAVTVMYLLFVTMKHWA